MYPFMTGIKNLARIKFVGSAATAAILCLELVQLGLSKLHIQVSRGGPLDLPHLGTSSNLVDVDVKAVIVHRDKAFRKRRVLPGRQYVF